MSQSKPWPGCDLVLEKEACCPAEVRTEFTTREVGNLPRQSPCLGAGWGGVNSQRAKWIMSEQLSNSLGKRSEEVDL